MSKRIKSSPMDEAVAQLMALGQGAKSGTVIAQLWESYEQRVYGAPLTGRQLIECRRAFYSGVAGCSAIDDAIDGLAKDRPELTVQDLRTILIIDEIYAFYDDVVAGKK